MRPRSWALAGTALMTATLGGALALAQEAATQPGTVTAPPAGAAGPAAPVPILTDADRIGLVNAISGPRRINPERDRFRNPLQTLQFFGVRSTDTVIEIWPGQGWYTSILAPYLRVGGGRLIAGHFDAASSGSPAVRRLVDDYTTRFAGNPDVFGSVTVVPFGPRSGPLGPPGSVDVVLTFRNVHNWVAQGWSEKAFADMFAVLKPGGILGIEDHRASPDEPQDPLASDGYVREDFVIQMAEEAGFEFIGRSEVNANPRDTRDHPFGVWTLPPVLRTSPVGQPEDTSFDNSRYRAIGESDRMTLRFRKPLQPVTAPPPPEAAARPAELPAGRPVDLSRPAAGQQQTLTRGAATRPAPPAQSPPTLPPEQPSRPVAPPPPPAPPPTPASPPPPALSTPAGASGDATGRPGEPGWVTPSPPAAAPPPPPPPPAATRRPSPPPPAAARPAPPPPAAARRPPPPPPAARRSPPPPAAARRPSPPPPPAARRPAPPPPPARRAPPPPPRNPNEPFWGEPKKKN